MSRKMKPREIRKAIEETSQMMLYAGCCRCGRRLYTFESVEDPDSMSLVDFDVEFEGDSIVALGVCTVCLRKDDNNTNTP